MSADDAELMGRVLAEEQERDRRQDEKRNARAQAARARQAAGSDRGTITHLRGVDGSPAWLRGKLAGLSKPNLAAEFTNDFVSAWLKHLRWNAHRWHSNMRGAALTIVAVTKMIKCAFGYSSSKRSATVEADEAIRDIVSLHGIKELATTLQVGTCTSTAPGSSDGFAVTSIGGCAYMLITLAIMDDGQRNDLDAGARAALHRMSCYFARASGLGRLGTGTTIVPHDNPVARARRQGVDSLAAMFLAGPLGAQV